MQGTYSAETLQGPPSICNKRNFETHAGQAQRFRGKKDVINSPDEGLVANPLLVFDLYEQESEHLCSVEADVVKTFMVHDCLFPVTKRRMRAATKIK